MSSRSASSNENYTAKHAGDEVRLISDDNRFSFGRLILIIIATVIPFVVPFVLVTLTGHDLFSAAPYYVGGDAVARYDYIRNILDHGKILGYNGYDFVTAKIPELGSAWGFFWTLPYLAFGKLFGWELNSPILANILFLCLANLIFILLTKCSNKSILLVIIVSCLLFIDIDYSVSAMSEPSRYAAAIIISGMLYRLASFKTSFIYKYLIVPAAIIYGSASFILMAAFIIPYCLIIIRTRSIALKGTLSLVVFFIGTYVIKKANSMYCTPYFQDFNMRKDIAAFREGGIGAGISMVIKTSLENLRTFTVGAFEDIHYQHGRFVWFVVVCWGLMLLFALLLLSYKRRTERDRYLLLGAFYILLIFIAGYIILYNDDRTTLIRGLNTALCAAVFLTTLLDTKKAIAAYIILALLWSPFYYRNFTDMCNDDYRFLTAEQYEEIEARRAVAAEHIVLDESPDADPWDNTVAIRFGGQTTSFVVPSGAGKVSMHKVTLNEKARYVMAGRKGSAEDIQAFVDSHLENGHILLVDNDDFTILKRVDD